MQETDTGHADETHHLPTPEDLRSYADDADQHGNRWVPIAPASLRGMADEIDRLRAALLIGHTYAECCPTPASPDDRDQDCQACAALGPNVADNRVGPAQASQ